MRNHIIISITLSLCFLAFQRISAQETTIVTSDFESWSSIGFKAKLTKQFDINLEQGLRLSRNATQLDQALTELSFDYEVLKHIELGLGLRYIYDRSNDASFDNDFRFNIDAAYKNKIKRLSYKIRLRYQNKNEIGYSISEGDEYKPYGRAKLSFDYNVRNWKLDPQFSTEIFRNLSSQNQFDRYRVTVGTSYKIKKYGSIKIFYGLESELNSSFPKTTYIGGIQYKYTLKTY